VSSAVRRARGPVGDVLAVLGTFVVLGGVAGLLWWVLAEPAEYTRGRAGLAMSELELARRFGIDGWFAVIALVSGTLGGVTVTWWRSRDFRVTTLLLVPASVVAATTMAAVGRLLGPDAPGPGDDLVRRGGSVAAELAVSAAQIYLLWPIAVLAGALIVLWSSAEPPPPSDPDEPTRTGRAGSAGDGRDGRGGQ
jgi:hypothetical protein